MIPIAHPLLGTEEGAAALRVIASHKLARGEHIVAIERRFVIDVPHARGYSGFFRNSWTPPRFFYRENIDKIAYIDAARTINGKRSPGLAWWLESEEVAKQAMSLSIHPQFILEPGAK